MVQLYTHTHTHLFIFRFFSLIGYYKILSIVPWVFVFIFKFFIWRFQKCTKQSSYMLFTQLPLLLASYIIIVQWLKLRNKLICTSFKDSTYKWYHMIFVFLWLTSLSMTICRYIHVAATDIILFFFFLWLSSILLWRRKWQSTPVFLPGESQGQRSLVGCCLWGHTWLKRLSSSSSILLYIHIPAVSHRKLFSQYSVVTYMGKEFFERTDVCIYTTDSLWCTAEINILNKL